MKKSIVLIVLCLLFVMTAGCGQNATPSPSATVKPEYPVMEDVTLNFELAEASTKEIKAQYPKDGWIFGETAGGLFAIYDASTLTDNINIVVSQPYTKELTEKDMKELVDEMKAQYADSISVNVAEMRSFCGAPVIYLEQETVITNELIDLLIEEGELTEEIIKQYGGREAFVSAMSFKQIALYAVADGHLLIFTGTYSDNSKKETMIEAMKVLIKTADVL